MSNEARLDDKILKQRLVDAEAAVTLGERYTDSRTNLSYYAAALALEESTGNVMVLHNAEHGLELPWINPLKDFKEEGIKVFNQTDEITLRARLEFAAEEYTRPGKSYVHSKSQKPYFIAGLALEAASGRVMVVYSAEYGEHLTWVRPFNSFVEEVKIDGQMVPRFTLAEDRAFAVDEQ